MILQALKDYYDRKAADPASGIAPEGWEWKEIPFIVVLDRTGRLMQIEDTREGDGRRQRGKRFLVPQSVKKTSGIAANLLWDTAAYALGVVSTAGLSPEKAKKLEARVPDQKKAFVERIRTELPSTDRTNALLGFLSDTDPRALARTPAWNDICTGNVLVSFRFHGDRQLYCQSPEVQDAVGGSGREAQANGVCLVSGSPDRICDLHTAIKGVHGAKTSGANIVSFNLDSFTSFGKKQGRNAPVGQSAVFAYTTALNALLSWDSVQRLRIGDASTVFWSAKRTQFESGFAFFFNEPPKDDPDSGGRHIKNLFESPMSGSYLDDPAETKFFVLGLSPNAARISVRFWQVGTVAEFASRIRRHFDDLRIVKPPREPEFYSLWRLLVNVAAQDKDKNIPPNVAGDFMRAILDGTPYPQTLLQLALRRIRSDTENRVKPVRAALIKAYMNRYLRAHPNAAQKEIAMGLDTEQPSIGYQLGRLFAALEKTQEEGNPGINATIRERYYGAGCSSPVTVFGTLMRLKNHWLAKIENRGRVVNLERLFGEIVGHFDDFPPHLDLHEQGRFAVGYYHQRQAFYTRSEDKHI